MGTTLRIVLLALALVAPAQAQDPADIIMQYFCQVAGMKPVEEGTCGVLCKGLEAVTEIPEAICMPLMEKGWEYRYERWVSSICREKSFYCDHPRPLFFEQNKNWSEVSSSQARVLDEF